MKHRARLEKERTEWRVQLCLRGEWGDMPIVFDTEREALKYVSSTRHPKRYRVRSVVVPEHWSLEVGYVRLK